MSRWTQRQGELHGRCDYIVQAGVLPAGALERGRAKALAKADEVLGGAEVDSAGLGRDEIAAINFYTQEHMEEPVDGDAAINVYRPMNGALRRQESAAIRPFWPYIKLLQKALLRLPVAHVDMLYRGSVTHNHAWAIRAAVPNPVLVNMWWAFSSTTASLTVATSPAFFSDEGTVCCSSYGSAARDVECVLIPTENELLMPYTIGRAHRVTVDRPIRRCSPSHCSRPRPCC